MSTDIPTKSLFQIKFDPIPPSKKIDDTEQDDEMIIALPHPAPCEESTRLTGQSRVPDFEYREPYDIIFNTFT